MVWHGALDTDRAETRGKPRRGTREDDTDAWQREMTDASADGEDGTDGPCEDWSVASDASPAVGWMWEADEELAEATLSPRIASEGLADSRRTTLRNACSASEACYFLARYYYLHPLALSLCCLD